MAHAHAVAEAGDGKREGTVGVGQGEGGRAQAEDGPGLGTGDGDAADGDAVDAAAGGALGVRDPGGGVVAEDGVGLGGGELVLEFLAGEGHLALIVGHTVPLRGGDALQVGDTVAPDLHGVLGGTGGGGVEDGVDKLTIVEDHLVGRVRHGGGNFIGVFDGLVPPVALGLVLGDPGLAAAVVGAEVGVGVVVGLAPVEGIGPGGHGLGFQGLFVERGGHLRCHHAPEILVQVHLGDLAVAALDLERVSAVGQGDLLLRLHLRVLVLLLLALVDERRQDKYGGRR